MEEACKCVSCLCCLGCLYCLTDGGKVPPARTRMMGFQSGRLSGQQQQQQQQPKQDNVKNVTTSKCD
jgi:hypothetical protein